MAEKALEGLKVVEFGSFISAPYCAKMMADLGAEVIKIELPKVGDESRRFGPFPGDVPNLERSGLFLYMNGNKLGVTLDPASATGQDIFNALVQDADVLVENQQPGVLKELGLDYEALRKRNPGLIVTSITTFGKTGPYRNYKGYDLTGWHASGCGHRYVGEPDREPLRGSWYHGSHWAATAAAAATMIAMAARDLTGEGQLVDVSEADVLATMIMGYQLPAIYHEFGDWDARGGSQLRSSATSGMFPCKDGHIFIMALEQGQWLRLREAMGDPDWAKDPLFAGNPQERAQYFDEVHALMEPWLLDHTKEELFTILQSHRIPSGPIYNSGDLVESEHFKVRGFFEDMDHPEAGRIKVPGRLYNLSETPWSLDRPSPTLGQHNHAIYGGRLGFSNVDLTDLRRTGII